MFEKYLCLFVKVVHIQRKDTISRATNRAPHHATRTRQPAPAPGNSRNALQLERYRLELMDAHPGRLGEISECPSLEASSGI